MAGKSRIRILVGSDVFSLFQRVHKGCEPYPAYWSSVMEYFPKIIDRAEVKNEWSYTSAYLYTHMT